MKIMNQQPREDETAMDIAALLQRTSIEQLNETTELREDDLMHLVQITDDSKDKKSYNSKKITVGTLQNKLYEAVQNSLHVFYSDCHSHDAIIDETPETLSWKTIVNYFARMGRTSDIRDIQDGVPSNKDGKGFVKHVNYDFELLRRYAIVRTKELEDRILRMEGEDSDDCMFASQMVLTTTDENGDVTAPVKVTENDTYCQMVIPEGNKISNSWTCPATGCLVVYGWVDSSKLLNNKAIPLSYCVLEANINEKWEIISVCSVIPSKNMTYVCFNVSAAKGLSIRARTGFAVGAKSGQYSQTADGYDTPLANNTPNGFLCTVYSIKIPSTQNG